MNANANMVMMMDRELVVVVVRSLSWSLRERDRGGSVDSTDLVKASSGITDRKGSGLKKGSKEKEERWKEVKKEDSCTFFPSTTPCAHSTLVFTHHLTSIPAVVLLIRRFVFNQLLHRLRKSPPPIIPAPNQPKGLISPNYYYLVITNRRPSIASSTNHNHNRPFLSI